MPLLLAVITASSGCTDALGPAGGCEAEKRSYLRMYGSPSSTETGQDGGDFFESWTFVPMGGEPGRRVTFNWGVSFDRCVVDAATFDLIPGAPRLSLQAAPTAASNPISAHRTA